WVFRDQLEQKVPYSTTTRRIELYQDHPWFIEADEHLVRFKAPPNIGGAQGRRLTSGHLRWSIHSNWVVADEMLKLHRGEPFSFINSSVAKEKGIADNDFIRVYNDYGSFVCRAKLSPCTRPDQLVIYHAWEPYQYPEWMPYDGLLPGPPKGLHFAGGYRHYEYTLWNWSPSQSDRQTNIDFEKANVKE
ncbi:MAG TPA: molybdopterin dinucleotide binding domain-containing protein, partial [Candidatus Binataceae bacterium]|nr:molybdopterin dinucleotide binding domain-containing protein [Candidatus Binataceae bacterium]